MPNMYEQKLWLLAASKLSAAASQEETEELITLQKRFPEEMQAIIHLTRLWQPGIVSTDWNAYLPCS